MRLVSSLEQLVENLIRFDRELRANPGLQSRLGHVHAWYAFRGDNGPWHFGPSKFVGYAGNTAETYLRSARKSTDGRETEIRLKEWARPVDPDSRLGRELTSALESFVAEWGRSLRKNVRISVVQSNAQPADRPIPPQDALLARISSDPEITGGRPCIKGTRMRVSDILGMLASGASRAEILGDFPYLTDDDISAALFFAAQASDHRVIRAA